MQQTTASDVNLKVTSYTQQPQFMTVPAFSSCK